MERTIEEIEKTLEQMPPDQLRKFRAWYEKFDSKVWDKQIEKDIMAGKLDNFAEEAITDYKVGKTKKL